MLFWKKIDLPYCLVLEGQFCSLRCQGHRCNNIGRSGELTGLFVDSRPLATLAGLILVTRHTMRSVNGSLDEPNWKLRSRSRKIKASLVNDLWEELRIEWMDMELQHLCFEFLEESRPLVIFQRNYLPRATDAPLSCLPLNSGTPK